MGDLPRIEMGDPSFSRMLARAIWHGGLFAIILQFLYLFLQLLRATPSWEGFAHVLISIPEMLPYIGLSAVFIAFVGVGAMAPMTALFAWPIYRRGVKSYAVYMAVGVSVGVLTMWLFTVIFDAEMIEGVSWILSGWVVSSSTFGGWSFAHQLRRQTNEP